MKPDRIQIGSSLHLKIDLENTPKLGEQGRCIFVFGDSYRTLTTIANEITQPTMNNERYSIVRFAMNELYSLEHF